MTTRQKSVLFLTFHCGNWLQPQLCFCCCGDVLTRQCSCLFDVLTAWGDDQSPHLVFIPRWHFHDHSFGMVRNNFLFQSWKFGNVWVFHLLSKFASKMICSFLRWSYSGGNFSKVTNNWLSHKTCSRGTFSSATDSWTLSFILHLATLAVFPFFFSTTWREVSIVQFLRTVPSLPLPTQAQRQRYVFQVLVAAIPPTSGTSFSASHVDVSHILTKFQRHKTVSRCSYHLGRLHLRPHFSGGDWRVCDSSPRCDSCSGPDLSFSGSCSSAWIKEAATSSTSFFSGQRQECKRASPTSQTVKISVPTRWVVSHQPQPMTRQDPKPQAGVEILLAPRERCEWKIILEEWS